MTVVVACKMIGLVFFFFVLCVLSCLRCWEWLKSMFSASSVVVGKKNEKLGQDKDLQVYVLQLQDDMEVSERTMKGLSKSMNRLIQKAEKQKPNNLLKLLEASRSFQGVEKFNSHHVPPLTSKEYGDCWSLQLVTLTTIAVSLPNIQRHIVDSLMSSVREGLLYVRHVEESVDATDDYISILKAVNMLWLEVEIYDRWLGKKLQNLAPPADTTGQILQRFKDTATNMVSVAESIDIGSPSDDSIYMSICANSMYRITETLMLSYNTNTDEVSQVELLAELSSMIADIFAACLTNLPHVITKKCHTSEIEKREESVHFAAQLLGETTQIINILQDRELPSLNPDELPFIERPSP